VETTHLLDSNVIIGYLGNKLPPAGMEFISAVVDDIPHISVISKIEVLRFNVPPEDEKVLSDFVDCSVVHPLDDPTVDAAIDLCRRSKIKLPDAVIAATAMLNDFTLLTRNVDDFKNIPGLSVCNPWQE
jgi:predicted nucleic acid-binding protein